MPDPASSNADSALPEGPTDASLGQDVGEVLTELYGQLRAVARQQFAREAEHTLQPTALVHEAFLRLSQQPGLSWRSRTHFFALAAREVRRVLVDHWRQRSSLRRDAGGHRTELDSLTVLPAAESGLGPEDLLDLDAALTELAANHERPARIAELAYFAGLTQAEIGELLGLSRKTIAADWSFARSWLVRRLSR